MLAQRALLAVVAIPLIVALVWLAPAWLFAAFVLVLALVAQWELYRMFARVGVAAEQAAGFLLGGSVVLAFAFGGSLRPWLVSLALSLAVAGCLALGLGRGSGVAPDWAGIALTLLGICYCAWLLGHAIWLRALPDGAALTLLVLGVTWCGETAAYFVGRRWGRRKLAPRISPAKTVEGAVAQVLVSVAAALLTVRMGVLTPWHAIGIGLTLGVLAQVGDLTESFLKRSAETKDASRLLPGHGGLLDRLDSLLFNVPALYYYVKLFSS
ncbi:MAG TPA: phosphatidate cytidylyltransferase [Methylomirabilota bacterium]|nr:phosphatidate cytidylyltransferase [Methylomirabilota bacterium]